VSCVSGIDLPWTYEFCRTARGLLIDSSLPFHRPVPATARPRGFSLSLSLSLSFAVAVAVAGVVVPYVVAVCLSILNDKYHASPRKCRSGKGQDEETPSSLLSCLGPARFPPCFFFPLTIPVCFLTVASLFLAIYPVLLPTAMESRFVSQRNSAAIDVARNTARGDGDEAAQISASSSLLKPSAQLTMDRFLQDLAHAEQPPVDFPPQYHTGRVPNSKAGDGKPRLLLMGQRRYVLASVPPFLD